VARPEKRLPRLDHLGRVAIPGHEIDVALLGDVEGVPLFAPQRPGANLEPPEADRAPKEFDSIREHARILPDPAGRGRIP
jgi:hypothetical protein